MASGPFQPTPFTMVLPTGVDSSAPFKPTPFSMIPPTGVDSSSSIPALPMNSSFPANFPYIISEKHSYSNFLVWQQQVDPVLTAHRLH